MIINILLEKDQEGKLGRSGFQIHNKNQKHMEVYLPKITSLATPEQVHNMHQVMVAMKYCKHNLKRLKFVKFILTDMPLSTNAQWKSMNEFVNKIATQIGCRIEYTKA